MKRNLKPTDEELMLRVQKGEMEPFEVLYGRYNQRLFHFILRFVKERTLAEDILQETFLRIFKERMSYSKNARFSTYLFTIGRNLCLDTLKTWEKRHILSEHEGHMDRAADSSNGPSRILEDTEMSRIIQREIQALPEDQRQVLLLTKYSGLSHEEVALIVKITPAAVKQKVYRAMLSLREKLKNLDE